MSLRTTSDFDFRRACAGTFEVIMQSSVTEPQRWLQGDGASPTTSSTAPQITAVRSFKRGGVMPTGVSVINRYKPYENRPFPVI